MMHSVYVINDNFREETMLFICQILKTKTLNCDFYCYLKPHFGTLDNKNRFCLFFFNKTTV